MNPTSDLHVVEDRRWSLPLSCTVELPPFARTPPPFPGGGSGIKAILHGRDPRAAW